MMTVLIGAGALGKEIAMFFPGPWVFLDPYLPEEHWQAIPVYRSLAQVPNGRGARFIASTAEPDMKRRISEEAVAYGMTPADPLIHERAFVHPSSVIGAGSVIYPLAAVSHNAVLGEHVVVSLHASVGHDCRVGTYTTLSPSTAISGRVSVGEGVFFGTNASVRQVLTIGDGCRISMGAVIAEDLPARTNAFVNPRLMKLPVEGRSTHE